MINTKDSTTVPDLQITFVVYYGDEAGRDFIKCPHCSGKGQFSYWSDEAGRDITEPCAGCDGLPGVCDGIYKRVDGRWDVWVAGEKYQADTPGKASKMYRTHWQALATWFEKFREMPF